VKVLPELVHFLFQWTVLPPLASATPFVWRFIRNLDRAFLCGWLTSFSLEDLSFNE
jgi:hypothetical protein